MRPLQHSLESEKLAAIIDEKTKYYNKLYRQDPGNQYLKILNSEITFLRDIIMPIVLMNTTVLYSGLAHFLTTAMRAMEGRDDREKFCGVMMYYQTHEPGTNEIPLVAVASNVKTYPHYYFNLLIDGEPALPLPVFPNLAEDEEKDWFDNMLKNLEAQGASIDTSKLQISTQKFVKP